jgi:hypothetical protein
VLGQSTDLTPTSGIVLIKPPPGQSLGHAADARTAAALSIGQGFVPLTEARRIPNGSQVDARRGSLAATTATGTGKGKTQQVTLRGGVFRFSQARSGKTKGLTTMSLLEGAFKGGPTFASCPAAAADDPVAQAALSRKILQTLHASDRHGRFATRGRYSAATVRGTNWNTIDRCTGTSTVVNIGIVSVQDFVHHRTVIVHGGHHYLARRP